jgi:enterochelin esterase-like enzyme
LSLFAYGQQNPCKSTVVGSLEIINLTSQVFHNTRKLRVWLPPQFSPSRKYPVLYVLDGASAFDACTAVNHQELGVDETLTELITAGKIPPLIAVGIDNASDEIGSREGESSRAREFLPYPDPYDPSLDPLGKLFPSFLATDVMPAIAARYPVLTGAENTALWGASFGGVAALYTLIHRPDLFGSMIVESPALYIGNGQLLRETQFLNATPRRIAIGVGTAEIGASQIPQVDALNAAMVRMVRQLVDNLQSAYLPGRVQLTVDPGASHNAEAFRRRLSPALLFIYGKP